MIPQNRINEIAVEQVALFNDTVIIDYYLPEWDVTKELTVPSDKYENHLKDILALDWSFQVMEGNVYKEDVEGTMSLAEYFADVDFQQRNKDAVSYLKTFHVERDGLADIKGAIANICREYIATTPPFPRKDTYPTPAPEVHNGHIAQLLTPLT